MKPRRYHLPGSVRQKYIHSLLPAGHQEMPFRPSDPGLERRPGRFRDFGENLPVALLSGEIFQGRDKTMRVGAIQPHQIDTIVVGPMLNLRVVNGLDGVHCFTPGT